MTVRLGRDPSPAAPLLLSTGPRPATVSFPVGSSPYGLAVDTANDRLYVANQGSDNVTVLNATTGAAEGAIGVGVEPRSVAVNESSGRVYVTNWGSNNVSVIDAATDTVLGSVPVGGMPEDILVDSANGYVYVTNWQSDNVTVFSCASDTVEGSIAVGTTPTGLLLNPANDEVYVVNRDSYNLSVIDGSNNSVVETVALPSQSGPVEMTLDSATGDLFVTDWYSNNVTVVDMASARAVAELPVGLSPWGIGLDATDGDLYVANSGESNVSVIGAASEKIVGSVLVGGGPTGLAIDPSTGEVFTANGGSGTVSAIAPTGTFTYPVVFAESGLPTGTNWSVTLNGSTNRSTLSTVNFLEPNGRYPFSISAGGYLGTPDRGFITVNGSPAGLSITFRPLPYLVTFTEHGLPQGDSWSVLLPAFGSNRSTNSSLTFQAPNGTWAYSVGAPCSLYPVVACWHASPSSGNLTVRGAPVTVQISFGLPGEFEVNFVESGLPAFSNWSVTLNGTNEASVTPSITFYERNSTSAYFVLPVSRYGISLASGNLTVAGANVTIPITFLYQVTAPSAYPVTFLESGLFTGAGGAPVWWQVSFEGGGRTVTAFPSSASSTSSTTFAALNGTYSYVAGAVEPVEAATPSYGYLTVRGAPVTIDINFTDAGALTCTGTIGLHINGTQVQGPLVSVAGEAVDSSPNCGLHAIRWDWGDGTSSSSSFPASHDYVTTGKFWIITTAVWTSGWTMSVTFSVTIVPTGYDVVFVETGLRPGANWTVDFASSNASGPADRSLAFGATNGSYAFDVGIVPGYLARPASGSVKVVGHSLVDQIDFTPVNGSVFLVSFDERGLIPGTNWSVSLNGSDEATIAGAIIFQEVNGSFPFAVHEVAGYSVAPTNGAVTLTGRSTVVAVTFSTPNPRPWWLFGLPGFTGYVVWAGAVITVVGGSAVAFHHVRLKRRAP